MEECGGVSVNGKDEQLIESVEEMAGKFSAELMTHLPVWKTRLADAPQNLADLERDVHVAFARGADLIVAGLLAVVMKHPDFVSACTKTKESFAYPLKRGRKRSVQIKLLGGLIMWVHSYYCEARQLGLWKTQPRNPGVYIPLLQFGIGRGVTPGLQSRVARQAAVCQSFELAQQELESSGLKLDVKMIRRITTQCGEELLQLRKTWLQQWLAGTLVSGEDLADGRVAVQIDGGRTRLRYDLEPVCHTPEQLNKDGLKVEDKPGRSKKKSKRTFSAEWREPKLMTIFVHNSEGRMVKQFTATIDGTFQGPDAIAELVAMHLHRLGAAKAKSITFVADGAPWIWDRIPVIVSKAKLQQVPTYEVLDNCHASHHVSLAMKEMGFDEAGRKSMYREHRTLLRNGQWRRVVDELKEFAEEVDPKSTVHTEIAYLEKHGEAGRLSYPHFRKLGLPLGSGAIESTIRRVVNLRLKSNAMFWREENAEAMMQVRAQVLTGQWDSRLEATRELRRHDVRVDWRWTPQPMSEKHEDNLMTSG